MKTNKPILFVLIFTGIVLS